MDLETKYLGMKLLYLIPVAIAFAIALLMLSPFLISNYKDSLCAGIWALSIFAILAAFVWQLLKGKPNLDKLDEHWQRYNRSLGIKVVPEFEMVAGEKILIPLSPCKWGEGYTRVRTSGIIITNKRILIGNQSALEGKETFGTRNFWHPSVKEIPEIKEGENDGLPGLSRSLFGNYRIESIKLEKSGETINVVGSLGPVQKLFVISHPRAKEIYEIFQKP